MDELMIEIKTAIINAVRNENSPSRIGAIFAETVGCMNCPIKFRCNRKINCNQNIVLYLKKGNRNNDNNTK